MRYTTDGIVIGSSNFGECDRLVTLLTKDKGVLRAFAGGAKRPGNKLSGSTELLCYSRFVLFSHKGRLSIDAADDNRMFWGIRGDIEKLSLASYFCELAAETSPTGEPAIQELRLLLNGLHLLESGQRSARFLKPVYELRQIALAGYLPDLAGCSQCGEFLVGAFHFYPHLGELRCPDCDENRDASRFVILPAAVLTAMRHILYSDLEKIFSFSLPEDKLQFLAAVSERYVQTQLSRTFSALEFYRVLFPQGIVGNFSSERNLSNESDHERSEEISQDLGTGQNP